jgi:hypothetical protein
MKFSRKANTDNKGHLFDPDSATFTNTYRRALNAMQDVRG